MSRPSVVESSFNCQVWWSDERFLVSLVPITSYLVLTNIINVKKDDMVSEPSHIMFLHCNPCHFFWTMVLNSNQKIGLYFFY